MADSNMKYGGCSARCRLILIYERINQYQEIEICVILALQIMYFLIRKTFSQSVLLLCVFFVLFFFVCLFVCLSVCLFVINLYSCLLFIKSGKYFDTLSFYEN